MSDLSVHRARLATGVTVPYTLQGAPEGTPVVLVHAWGESLGCFDTLVSHLPMDMRVVAWDLRGHGAADKPHEGYRLEQVADDVAALLDALGIGSAVLAGSSSGGYVAQQVAVSHPDRVRALVLVGAPLDLHTELPIMAEVEALRDPIDPATVRALVEAMTTAERVPDWYLEDRIRDGLAMPAELWRSTLRGLTEATAPTRVGRIRCPALVLWGADDALLDASQLTGLREALPHALVISYADTGHTVLWERPELVAADLVTFVRALRSPPASL